MQAGRAGSGYHPNFLLFWAVAKSASAVELVGLAPHELRLLSQAGEGGHVDRMAVACGGGRQEAHGLEWPAIEGLLMALGMEAALVEQMRALLLGLLLLGQVVISGPLLLQLARSRRTAAAVIESPRDTRGCIGSQAAGHREPPPPPGAAVLAACEALLGVGVSEALMRDPLAGTERDSDGGFRASPAAEEARDAIIS